MKKFVGLAVLTACLAWGAPAGGQAPPAEKGKVLAWGENDRGQLGLGNTTPRDLGYTRPYNPALVPSLSKITAIAAGTATAAAIDSEGSIWLWGPTAHAPVRNGVPVLGTPVKLPGLSNVIAVALGDFLEQGGAFEHGLALKSDGTVWAWGANLAGELGREPSGPYTPGGKIDFSDAPIIIQGLSDVAAIAAGQFFSLALKSDGTVWAWGTNQNGQLGNGSYDPKLKTHARPELVPGLKNIKAISVGLAHCLALDSEGVVWGWGFNAKGALARPLPPTPETIESDEALKAYLDKFRFPTPAKIAGLPKIKAISARGATNMALTTDGLVYVWGHHVPRRWTPEEMREKNIKPEDNAVSIDHDASYPVLIEGLDNVAGISLGGLIYMALKTDGSVWTWGTGNYRVGRKDARAVDQLSGSEIGRLLVTPTQVQGVTATLIAAGAEFFLACGGAPRASFLDWYVGFSRLVKDRVARVHNVRAEAASIALPLAESRRQLARLNKALTEAERASRAGEETASQEVVARLKAKFTAESALCQMLLRRLDQSTAKGNTAMADILAALKTGLDSFGDQETQAFLLRWKEHFDGVAAEVPMEMALAAREDDAVADEVQRGGLDKLAPGLKVKVGNYLLSRGEVADAVYVFRSVLKADPDDAGAEDGLARAEAAAMKLALVKSSGALAEARAAFYKFVEASGYSDGRMELWEWKWDWDLDWLATESWSALIHLPVNLADLLFDRSAAEEGRVQEKELELVRNLLVVPIIIRLRLKGYTLDEIQRLPGREIQNILPLQKLGARPYTDKDLNALGAQIHSAMAMGDFPLLLKKDAGLEELRTGLLKPFIAADELPDTWHNEFGSFLVENAVMLAMPMFRVMKGGATITEGLAYITRFERAAQWIGGTAAGERLLQGLQQYHEIQAALIRAGTWAGRAKFVGLKGGELLALALLQGYTIDLANRLGGENAAVVASLLVMMATDLDLLMRWLQAGKIAKQAALAALDEAIVLGERAAAKIDENAAITKRLRELKDKWDSRATFSREEMEFVAKHKELAPDFFPNGDAVHDAELPRRALAQEASTGADGGAAKACEDLGSDAAKEKGRLAGETRRTRETREKIASAPEPVEPPAPPGPPRSRLAGKNAPEAWKQYGGYRVPDGPAPGSKWAQAEEAMRKGKYAEARELYGHACTGGEISDGMLEAFAQRADEAAAAKRSPETAKQNTSAEFPPEQVDNILKRNWEADAAKRIEIKRSDPQAFGRVYKYVDETGTPYFIKEIPLDSPRYRDMVDNALVASRLMDELGIPNCRVAVRTIEENGVKSARFIYRWVDGTDMNDLTSGKIFLYRKELSEQRAFALLVRDYDRKPPNFKLGKDGQVYYLDADLATVHEAKPLFPGKMEGRGGNDHWYWRSNEEIKQLAGTGKTESYAQAVRYNLAERSLTANDAQSMVARIRTLLDPAHQTKLENILTRAFREARGPGEREETIRRLVGASIRTMRDRLTKLPETLKYLNERNGAPLPAGGTGFESIQKSLLFGRDPNSEREEDVEEIRPAA